MIEEAMQAGRFEDMCQQQRNTLLKARAQELAIAMEEGPEKRRSELIRLGLWPKF